MIRSRGLGALALVAALLPSVVLAQGATSVLTGNVVDTQTHAPVPDVVVTATSPSLQGEQVVVTDSTGLYRIPQLPPGTYTLRFEKETYRPYTRTGIDVAADRTLRLNVELLPEAIQGETITVTGAAPVVDVGSSTVGATINQDFIRNFALSRAGGVGGAVRSFDSIATAAPQAAVDLYGISISGSTSPENSYLIDGLAVNNPAYGVLGTPLTVEFLDEINVITGGYMPEYGRTTGGAVSGITKSGGNEFHGSVWGTFTPGALQGRAKTVTTAGAVVAGTRDLYNIGDFGATLGGYIIKDKLWFFAGVQPSFTRYSYKRQFYIENPGQLDADGNQAYSLIPNSEQRRFADEKSIQFIGKLTYLISSDHRLSLTVTGTPTTGGSDSAFSVRVPGVLTGRAPFPIGAYTLQTFNSNHFLTNDTAYDVNGELNSSFLDKRLLLDVRLGWHHQIDEGAPGDGTGFDNIHNLNTLAGIPSLAPLYNSNVLDFEDQVPASVREACGTGDRTTKCQTSWNLYGGNNFLERQVLDSFQGKATITYLLNALGHHVIKAGVDGSLSYYDHLKTYGGGAWYFDFGPGPSAGGTTVVQEARRFGYLSDIDTTAGNGILNAKSKSVIIGGFVQDSWSILDKVTLNVGLRWDGQYIYDKDGLLGIKLGNEWSPRIGFVWDPTQQGRSKIFANYGRYYEAVPLDIADRALSGESLLIANHDCDPRVVGVAGCDLTTANRGSNIARPNVKWRNVAVDKTAVDPNLQPTSNDEIVAGGEYEVFPSARLGVSYTYRNLVRTIEDMSADNGNTYFVGNPGEGIATSFPKATRTYHAVTLQFTKNFSDLWQAQVSYTWSQLRGNYEGLFVNGTGQLDPNINATFDLAQLLVNQDGPLSGDITHTIKVFAAKEFIISSVLSLSLGLTYTGASGPPISYTGPSNETGYGPGQVYILQRGQGGRLPWVHSVDARLALNYRLSKDSVITVGVDGFNLFNFQNPIRVDEEYVTLPSLTGGGRDPGPIVNGTQGTIPAPYGVNGYLPRGGVVAGPNGVTLKTVVLPDPDQQPQTYAINPNWGRPTQYQAVRSFRFTARFSF
ncbi:MAG TPA: TonB-dependent receptor [Myxococcaceae bacterium]|nr:TonB-dependent receptor [Myxococcaceae bacterium]